MPGGPGSPRWNMTNHRPSDLDMLTIEALRGDFIDVAENVESSCPSGRERSLAITKLEEALMWAVASIARQPQDG